MTAPDNRPEFRIAVVMAGGVSLAIWIGGVAAELLRLVEKPRDYGIDDTKYKPVIDIIAGTSVGGLNGALLAGIDNMLRSPMETDPPSLLSDRFWLNRATRRSWSSKRISGPLLGTRQATSHPTLLPASLGPGGQPRLSRSRSTLRSFMARQTATWTRQFKRVIVVSADGPTELTRELVERTYSSST